MKCVNVGISIALAVGFAVTVVAARAEEKRDTSVAASPAKTSPKNTEVAIAPVYRPPARSAPGGRVSGATRGDASRTLFVLSALAPDHTGLTTSEQPVLYWFLSRNASFPVEVTLVDPRSAKPVLDVRLPPPIEAGVHAIRLADHNVRLERGVVYRWYVAVVPDAKRRSQDILTGGAIQQIEASDSLRAKLSRAGGSDVPALYAESGFWYDAIAAVSTLIESAPTDAALRAHRAAMLAQVGLPEIKDQVQ